MQASGNLTGESSSPTLSAANGTAVMQGNSDRRNSPDDDDNNNEDNDDNDGEFYSGDDSLADADTNTDAYSHSIIGGGGGENMSILLGDESNNGGSMSKNMLKRMLKEERWKASKQRKKQERRIKKARPADDTDNNNSSSGGDIAGCDIQAVSDSNCKNSKPFADNSDKKSTEAKTDEGGAISNNATSYTKLTTAERRELKQQKHFELCDKSFDVIIDCSFEKLHSDSSLKSLCQQIAYCHGFAQKHSNPSRIFLTGIGDKMISQLNKSNFSSWLGTEHSKDDYISHPRFAALASEASTFLDIKSSGNSSSSSSSCSSESSSSSSGSNSSSGGGFDSNNSNSFCDGAGSKISNSNSISSNSIAATPKKKKIVYLTGDSENTLVSLDPDCAYIIGGIVDRNMHKGATFDKATLQNIETAKFPIREHCDIKGTHILTVNHVFEIMLNFAECQDWSATLLKTLPSRKTEQKQAKVQEKDNGEEEEEEAEEVNDEGMVVGNKEYI